MKPKELHTDRKGVVLKEATKEDDIEWLLANRHFTHHLKPHMIGAPDVRKYSKLRQEREEEIDVWRYGVWDKALSETPVFLGFVSFSPVETEDADTVKLECEIVEEYRGRGYGKLAVKAAINRAHEEGFERIVADVPPENIAARILAESIGFRPAGESPGHIRYAQDATMHEPLNLA